MDEGWIAVKSILFANFFLIISVITLLLNEGCCLKPEDTDIILDIFQKMQAQLQSANKDKVLKNLSKKGIESNYGPLRKQDLLQSSEQLVQLDDDESERVGDNVKSIESNELDLKKLLSNYYVEPSTGNNAAFYQSGAKKHLKPNDLTGHGGNYIVSDNTDDLQSYSKIYIILNPQALNKKSKYKNNLSDLISEIISTFSSNGQEKRKNTHKGFFVKDDEWARRYSRDSKEGRDSMEDDYKPKRQRSEFGVRPGAGRTAIPYIRQRGDIYERDN